MSRIAVALGSLWTLPILLVATILPFAPLAQPAGGQGATAADAPAQSSASASENGVPDEEEFLEAETASLSRMQLAVARRLGEVDLAPGMRPAFDQRHQALASQEARAEELRVVQEEVGALAQRFAEELEPLVQQRTLAQHLEEAGERLRDWWNAELFVFQDQGFRFRDIAAGLGVFALVMVAVASLKALLRRTLLPRLVGGLGQEGRTSRALVLALLRNTNLVFVAIVAFYAAMVTSGLAQGQIKAWLWTLLIVAFWLQIGIWATGAAVDLLNLQRSRKELRDPSAVTGYGLILRRAPAAPDSFAAGGT